MNDITCSEQEFYQQRKQYGQLSFLVVFIVFLFHVSVFAGALILPAFFAPKPVIHEIMTIDLVSMPEPAIVHENVSEIEPALETEDISPVVPEPSPSVEAVAIEPVVEPFPEPVVIAEPVVEPVPEPIVIAEPVSITPLLRKEQIAVDTRLEEEKLLADKKLIEERMRKLSAEADLRKRQQEELEKRVRQEEERKRLVEKKKRQEEARKQEIARAKILEQQARDEAKRARQELAMLHKTRDSAGLGDNEGDGRSISNSQAISNVLLNQYTANIHARVERYWQLPDMRQWPEDIQAVIEFTVHRDGSITGLKISSSSGDKFYDRFAIETVRKAVPMPPIPAALRKNYIDYGLIFEPSGIQ